MINEFTDNCLRMGLYNATIALAQYKKEEAMSEQSTCGDCPWRLPETCRVCKAEERARARVEPDSDVVYSGAECPRCGENRVDYLKNDEGDVTCATCGHKYSIR